VWQQFGHGPCWLTRTVPAVAWKRKPVQRPRDLRSGVACSTALQRHCRARLQGLLNEAVQQDRRSVCNRKTRVSCPSISATERQKSVALQYLQQKKQSQVPFFVCNRKTMVSCTSPRATHTHTRTRARARTHLIVRKPESLERRGFTTDHTLSLYSFNVS